jgi:molybdopterin-containing oxidoreductase family iron-sulfur binding subunit
MNSQDSSNKLTRREVLKAGVTVAVGTAALSASCSFLAHDDTASAQSASSETVRMHNDLIRALGKPIERRKWAMVIDTRRCIGCSACAVACIAQNALPPGVTYRTVPEAWSGEYPNLKRFFMPTNCMQCQNAPCVKAANAVIPGAMAQRPDGIVTVDYTKMKGRKVFEAARSACPYGRALWYDEGKCYAEGAPSRPPYDTRPSAEYGKVWPREQLKGTTRKCHFCIDRVEAGQLPACVSTCPGLAMRFGDINDPDSLVGEELRAKKLIRLAGTQQSRARVFYVSDAPDSPTGSAGTCAECHTLDRG